MIEHDAIDALTRAGVATVRPGDGPAYEELRHGFNRRFDARPALIALPRDTRGAAVVLGWCVERGIPLRIRSGGHCNEDWSLASDDGVLIDMRRLNQVEVRSLSNGGRQVVAGVGARVSEVLTALEPHGLALPAGLCADVGIGGTTLGGGVGVLTRSHGLMSDRVVAMEAVLASGDVVEITGRSVDHAQLLWALRGAGNGNFALVTCITFDPVVLPQVLLYDTHWPFSDMRTVLDVWHRWAPHAPKHLASSFAQIFAAGDDVVIAGLILPPTPGEHGSDEQAVRSVLSPLLDGVAPVQPLSLAVKRTTCHSAVQHFGPDFPEPLSFKYKAAWIAEPLPADAFQAIEAALSAVPHEAHGDLHVEILAMGGAARRPPQDEGAFAHRDVLHLIEFCSRWRHDWPQLEPDRIEWTRALHRVLEPHLLPGAGYVNSCDDDLDDPERGYYGTHVGRLREIKRRYDPENVFSHPGSVRG